MRAPWTVLRDTNTELRRERDERAELIALRKERIVLRTMLWTGYAGMVLVIGWEAAGPESTMSGARSVGAILAVLTGTLLAGGIAMAVAHGRHGKSDSPEAKRADATRTLLLLPIVVPLTAALYWQLSNSVAGTVTWAVVSGLGMTGALLFRRWRYTHLTRHEAETDADADADATGADTS